MWTILKLARGFISGYRYYVMAAGAAVFLGIVYLHVRGDGIRDARLTAAVELLHERNGEAIAYRAALADTTARLAAANTARLTEIAEADAKLQAVRETAAVVREQNASMRLEIGSLRFAILEEMNNDEDFTDWSYSAVHVSAWRLLRDAAEGTATD